MKRDMLKAAETRFARLSKSKRKALAKKSVDMFVAKIRKDVKGGKAYVAED